MVNLEQRDVLGQPNDRDDELEAAVDQAIALCDGDMRAAVRALIVANNFLESEISELKIGRIARLHAGALSHLHVIDVTAW